MSNHDIKIKAVEAYNLIRGRILTGEALPGSRLVISELEQKLGVGKGPIREALMRLDKSGLVENVPHKGAIVIPPPSLKEMQYIYNARLEIELSLSIEAMQHATKNDIARLNKIQDQMRINKDIDELFFENDKIFHAQLYALAQMPHLQATTDRLMDYVDLFLNSYRYTQENKDVFLEQHRCILIAMENKDEAVLKEQLKNNIMIGFELVEQEFARLGRRY